uniref:Uncharacterized protein n=1 Tax=Plectus sambesii TaxID=2011161 RepID=A0A914VN38_9BILA
MKKIGGMISGLAAMAVEVDGQIKYSLGDYRWFYSKSTSCAKLWLIVSKNWAVRRKAGQTSQLDAGGLQLVQQQIKELRETMIGTSAPKRIFQ